MPRVPQGRVTLQGQLANNLDIWSMSFAIDPLAGRSQSDLQAIAEQIKVIFKTHVWDDTDVSALVAPSTTFESVRVDDVREPGGVVRQALAQEATANPGTSTSPTLPAECSMVISLTTGLPGPSRRGRMYFPPHAMNALGGAGMFSTTTQNTMATAFEDFFNALNGDALVAATAFVASDTLQALNAITGLRVGSVVDSQRRRRNAINEIYVTRTVIV